MYGGGRNAAVGLLQQLVSGYQPSGEVVDWVHLAQEREALANE
jgi:hypothetical protein